MSERRLERARRKRFTVQCDRCREYFNAEEQSGICPHKSMKEFLNTVYATRDLN